jgi:hypothetical protein
MEELEEFSEQNAQIVNLQKSQSTGLLFTILFLQFAKRQIMQEF